MYSKGENMTTNLKSAPLIYTIGMMKFPRIPDIERFIDAFHDKIRKDYPFCDEFKVSVLHTDLCSQGLQYIQNENKVWQFTSVDQTWAFILTDQSLCLHTIDYQNFLQFSERFKKGLSTIVNIPAIGLDWVTAIGIRYVNLIETEPNKKLSDYILPWALPPEPSQRSLTTLEGAYVTRYKTDEGELRLQALLNPGVTLPSELQSSLIAKNGWVKERPESSFAVIDIDHSITFAPPKKAVILQALETLSNLQKISKIVFKSIGTKLSHTLWSKT